MPSLSLGCVYSRKGNFSAQIKGQPVPCSGDSPFAGAEFRRMLCPGGHLVYAVPTARHLYGLKSVLYDEPRLNEVKPYEIEGMEFLEKREVSSTLRLTSQELLNALFTMTPYYYKTSQHDSSRLYSWFGTHDSFETETEFQVLCYRVK